LHTHIAIHDGCICGCRCRNMPHPIARPQHTSNVQGGFMQCWVSASSCAELLVSTPPLKPTLQTSQGPPQMEHCLVLAVLKSNAEGKCFRGMQTPNSIPIFSSSATHLEGQSARDGLEGSSHLHLRSSHKPIKVRFTAKVCQCSCLLIGHSGRLTLLI
jgi:hypothetical protein